MMPSRVLPIALMLILVAGAGCVSTLLTPSTENAFVNQSEAVVRLRLGKAEDEFEGHYGAPPIDFQLKFPGRIKTLLFKKRGGEYYVTFEKRSAGWVCISSSWLEQGAVF